MLRRSIGKALLTDGIIAEVNFIRVTDEAACTMGLPGSPTVLVNGTDPFPRPKGTGA